MVFLEDSMSLTLRRFVVTALAAVCALAIARALAAESFINVLTGVTSGGYYPLGVALANNTVHNAFVIA